MTDGREEAPSPDVDFLASCEQHPGHHLPAKPISSVLAGGHQVERKGSHGEGNAGMCLALLIPCVPWPGSILGPLGTSSAWPSLLKSTHLEFLGIYCLVKIEIK